MNGQGPVTAGGVVSLPVLGRGGVPASGVGAVVVNVTVTEPTAAGFVTVYPNGTTAPNASNLSFMPGQTIPNLVVAKVGTDGRINLRNTGGATHLIADVPGWLPKPLTGAAAVVVVNYSSCVLVAAGEVKCWGYNDEGRLGDGTTIDSHVPATVISGR